MRTGGTRAGFCIAFMVVLAIAASANGQRSSCCSTGEESQLVLSEFNFREVSVSNALQYLCEQVEKEDGIKLKLDFDANPPEVHIRLPSGLGNEGEQAAQELKKQVEEQVASLYIPPNLWNDRKITVSLRDVPVCVVVKYVLGLSDAEITCQSHDRSLTLGHPQVWRVGRIYQIRVEAWKELERVSKSERQRVEEARRGVHFDFGEMFFPAHVCLRETRLVVAVGINQDLDYFKKELIDRGWLETATDPENLNSPIKPRTYPTAWH